MKNIRGKKKNINHHIAKKRKKKKRILSTKLTQKNKFKIEIYRFNGKSAFSMETKFQLS